LVPFGPAGWPTIRSLAIKDRLLGVLHCMQIIEFNEQSKNWLGPEVGKVDSAGPGQQRPAPQRERHWLR